VSSNFTVNLGLRYEYWGTVGNILPFPTLNTQQFGRDLNGAVFPNYLSTKQQGDKNNFAPRIGLAYTPKFWNRIFGNGKTVFRARYGIFYDGIFTNILDNSASSVPNVTGGTFVATSANSGARGLPDATGLLASLTPVPTPTATLGTMATHILNPLTHQWKSNDQGEYGHDMSRLYGKRGRTKTRRKRTDLKVGRYKSARKEPGSILEAKAIKKKLQATAPLATELEATRLQAAD
jgi:hypothetical protein